MKLLNPVLKKLRKDSVAVPEWYFSNQDPLWSGTIQNLQMHLVSLCLLRAAGTLYCLAWYYNFPTKKM